MTAAKKHILVETSYCSTMFEHRPDRAKAKRSAT